MSIPSQELAQSCCNRVRIAVDPPKIHRREQMIGSQSGAKIEGKNSEETLWRQIIAELQGQLADAEEVLQAISEYKVDAFVMGHHDDKRVYTLKGSDHIY